MFGNSTFHHCAGPKNYSRIVAPIFSKVNGKVFSQEPDRIFVDFFEVLFSVENLREAFHFLDCIELLYLTQNLSLEFKALKRSTKNRIKGFGYLNYL
jgi:hypothetical protein